MPILQNVRLPAGRKRALRSEGAARHERQSEDAMRPMRQKLQGVWLETGALPRLRGEGASTEIRREDVTCSTGYEYARRPTEATSQRTRREHPRSRLRAGRPSGQCASRCWRLWGRGPRGPAATSERSRQRSAAARLTRFATPGRRATPTRRLSDCSCQAAAQRTQSATSPKDPEDSSTASAPVRAQR